ncbi:MAG: hypothetical protein DRQ02_08310 [Candidatus Latescibacterota bacterium]|nr:MAG: hypothetical protein DRQ02_08310 [Candidatus Latescibacterota bacterium]
MMEYVPSSADLATVYHGPTRVWISGPSIVSPGEKFDLRISLLRLDGYLSTDFEGELLVQGNTGIEGIPTKIVFSKENHGTLAFSCSVSEEGIHRFKVLPAKGSFPAGQCHPIWVRSGFPYRLFWGDLHVHSVLGKCGIPHLPKSPDFGYWYARQVVGHDFCAMADHASKLNADDWEELKASAARWHLPGEFVTVLGFEGDYDGEDGGHFNLYFPSEQGTYRNFKLEAGGSLDAIFQFAREHHALAICHHSGRTVCGRDFAQSHYGGQDIEPVMEIYSQWGSSEEYASSRPIIEGRHRGAGHYYRYALSHGFRLGVIGGSDNHCTVPGGPVPMVYPQWGGKLLFPYVGGVGAVYAKGLTRQDLFEALRARRCYATSFEKILVWTESDGSPMGSEIEATSADIDILVSCTYGPLVEVVVVKDGQVAARFGDHAEDKGFDAERKTFHLLWHDRHFSKESSYYVRATQFDGDIAWSSPIWIRPK